jgi:hypothetical protein
MLAGMLASDVFRGRRGIVAGLAAAGLIVGLECSCAQFHGKGVKKPAAATAATGTAAVPAAPAGAGVTAGHFITRASVEQTGTAGSTSTASAASPGSELVEHALAGAGPETGGTPTSSSSSGAGGDGVPIASAERRVGVVRVIGARGRFVLIETTTGVGGVPLGTGQELRCRGAASGGGVETATLKVSPERQAPYLVADVVSGVPQTGDVAYFAVPPKR